jgi:hypothetical protein
MPQRKRLQPENYKKGCDSEFNGVSFEAQSISNFHFLPIFASFLKTVKKHPLPPKFTIPSSKLPWRQISSLTSQKSLDQPLKQQY